MLQLEAQGRTAARENVRKGSFIHAAIRVIQLPLPAEHVHHELPRKLRLAPVPAPARHSKRRRQQQGHAYSMTPEPCLKPPSNSPVYMTTQGETKTG